MFSALCQAYNSGAFVNSLITLTGFALCCTLINLYNLLKHFFFCLVTLTFKNFPPDFLHSPLAIFFSLHKNSHFLYTNAQNTNIWSKTEGIYTIWTSPSHQVLIHFNLILLELLILLLNTFFFSKLRFFFSFLHGKNGKNTLKVILKLSRMK